MPQKKGGELSRFLKPLTETLRIMGCSASSSEATDTVIEITNLSEEGGSESRNHAAWARQYSISSGLIDSSKRGILVLTEQGFKTPLEESDIFEIVTSVRLGNPIL